MGGEILPGNTLLNTPLQRTAATHYRNSLQHTTAANWEEK